MRLRWLASAVLGLVLPLQASAAPLSLDILLDGSALAGTRMTPLSLGDHTLSFNINPPDDAQASPRVSSFVFNFVLSSGLALKGVCNPGVASGLSVSDNCSQVFLDDDPLNVIDRHNFGAAGTFTSSRLAAFTGLDFTFTVTNPAGSIAFPFGSGIGTGRTQAQLADNAIDLVLGQGFKTELDPQSGLVARTLIYSAVPEPGTALLLGAGLVGLVTAGRKRS